ncbi:hypothetical protein COCOR_04564 [Corallococcus coralloides DSM 2259]|uniref:Lipoprotein n=1 Tax=Corallococcus coralloides (strain ATCC 25202 / DSM 2259 / NBRC 100086 / M2) TaxID=1144275 RepID=H8MGT7_CORCM|nr:hypothetical protein [Corallococcus coralloides]AFE05895.1 hypothetical protein COCOR_04564 [Corallococcus coralloides DSM 2259]
MTSSRRSPASLFAAMLLALIPAVSAAQTSTVQRLGTPSLSSQPGQTVTVAMRFNAVPMSQSYYVFVHLVDANGVQYPNLGADHLPPVSTATWSGAIAYNRVVALPTNLASGTYTVRVGLYNIASPMQRVALATGSGVTADNELRYTVGTLTVGGGQPTGNGPVGQDASAYVLTSPRSSTAASTPACGMITSGTRPRTPPSTTRSATAC